ncbi:MAG: hypothetical protein A2341_08555 [Deltaproteobacteria bacterium RIFOXYB12_FULL_58_9]|nr:MAG: hypothetical protein A2341_08555 [Deltaproteobacteria bacterium RIFOXYB12_FULL_58_9]
MSSLTGGGIPTFQPPTFNEASGVLGQIQTQAATVNDVFQEVQAILREIRALEAPEQPVRAEGETDEAWTKRQNDFQVAMGNFQRQLANLNDNLRKTFRKLGQMQAKLRRLESQDLPAAQRRDAEKIRQAVEEGLGALRAAGESLKGASEESDFSARKEDTKIEIRVIEEHIDIRLKDDPSFKEVISAFSLYANTIGTTGGPAFQDAMRNAGLNMPDFMANSNAQVISGLDPSSLQTLTSIAATAGALSVSGGGAPQNTSDLQGRWAEFISKQNLGGATDVNALVQMVLREAYMENTKDLHFYAQKVRYYNQMKKNIREELTAARKFLSNYAGQESDAAVNWNNYANSTGGKGPVAFSSTPNMDTGTPTPADPTGTQVGGTDGLASNKDGLEGYIQKLEEQLNSVGDDAQLANVDLQNMLQKQQQTLQMMSNISKMLHDTAMAIIRKIGA